MDEMNQELQHVLMFKIMYIIVQMGIQCLLLLSTMESATVKMALMSGTITTTVLIDRIAILDDIPFYRELYG